MKPIRIMFGWSGRIDRLAFLTATLTILAIAWLAVRASFAALPWMASMLAPRGVNAAFALNAIWLTIGMLTVWSLIVISAKRLRERELWPWWGALSIIPLAVLALANDTIFLISRIVALPAVVDYAILAGAGALGLWVLVQCLLPAKVAL